MVLNAHLFIPLVMVLIVIGVLFRASSGKGASQALQSLSHEVGFPHLGSRKFTRK
jgi:preprotein translocase subunit SecG